MVVTVQFKDKNKVFKGRTYDFILNKDELPPKKDAIIRMMDNDYNYIFYGTRVKVVDVRKKIFSDINLNEIRYVTSSLD